MTPGDPQKADFKHFRSLTAKWRQEVPRMSILTISDLDRQMAPGGPQEPELQHFRPSIVLTPKLGQNIGKAEKYEVRGWKSTKYEVRGWKNTKYEVRGWKSTKYEVRSTKYEVRSTKYGAGRPRPSNGARRSPDRQF